MRRVRSRSLLQPVSLLSVGPVCLAGVLAALGLTAAPAVAQDCPNAAIRAQQGPVVEALPDCMALEMVSPPQKYVQNAFSPSISIDGERVSFVSRGAMGDTTGVVGLLTGDLYIASRGAAGWSTDGVSPPAVADGNLVYTYDGPNLPVRSLTPDFSRWVTFAATQGQYVDGVARYFQDGLDGSFSPVSPLLVPVDGSHAGMPNSNVASNMLQAVSGDHERVYFAPGDRSTAFLAGDPSPDPTVFGGDPNVYVAEHDEAGEPSISLLARDGTGTVWGARCGSRVGGVVRGTGSATNGRDQGAVSQGGDRVYFSTRPAQSGSGACDTFANSLRIMRRVETPSGLEISELFASECDRVAPACSAVDGSDLYQGASVDGTKVYFTSTRQLADSDLDAGFAGLGCSTFFGSPGCDLYLYDSQRPAGDRLMQVSAGDAGSPTPGDGAGVLDGIAAVSADGSHAYFVAQGVLTSEPNSQGQTAGAFQSNLYSFTYDEANPDGRIAFIGAVGGFENLTGAVGTFKGVAWPVPVRSDSASGGAGDGHVLVFQSSASLTADDTDGGRRDLFRYDSETGELVRLSRAAPGGSDNGAFDIDSMAVVNPARVGTSYGEFGRWTSDDGQTVALTTAEALIASDTNGTVDTYVVRDEVPYLLPGTRASSFGGEIAPAVSTDGNVIAYTSVAALLGSDGDTVTDIYAARVDGGFEEQSVMACDPLGGDCQGPGANTLDGTSKTDSGGGNASPGGRGRIALAGLSAAQRRALAAGRRTRLRVRVTGSGEVRVVGVASISRRWRRVIAPSLRAVDAGMVEVPIRLTARGRAALRNKRKLTIRLTVRFSNAKRPVTRVVSLERPAKSNRGGRR